MDSLKRNISFLVLSDPTSEKHSHFCFLSNISHKIRRQKKFLELQMFRPSKAMFKKLIKISLIFNCLPTLPGLEEHFTPTPVKR